MPRKSNKRTNKKRTMKQRLKIRSKSRSKKQKPIIMIGCSKKKPIFSSLGNKSCSKCGPNCNCGPNCKCSHPCPGNCYMKKQKGGSWSGSGCGSCGCPMAPLSWDKMNSFVGTPILGIAQNGGNCTTCMKGGSNFFKPPLPIPGPILGSPWNTLVKGLPGENGIGGDRNYLASYAGSITNDPQQQMSMSGSGYKTANSMVGGRHNKRHKNKRGGGFIPTDLLNLGRNVNYSINSAYNTLNGHNPPVNHLPYKDQLTGALNKGRFF
jgi:hypothetical protein